MDLLFFPIVKRELVDRLALCAMAVHVEPK